MRKSYNEFSFDDDIELMNLTYKMNTGNFMNYENSIEDEIVNINDINKIIN